MNEELREQVYKELNLRETNDLLDIWKKNDREEWSDVAFDVIKEILGERIGEILLQGEPILERTDARTDDGLEDWEAKLLDDANQPELYDTLEVLRLRDNINRLSIAVIIVYVLLGLSNIEFVRMLFQGVLLPFSEVVQSIVSIIFTLISVGLQIVILYFPLKALMQVLRILMEMEFNSRKAK